MKKQVGLWIDHRQAVLVVSLDQEEEVKHITSNMEPHTRYSGASEPGGEGDAHNDTTENGRERRFENNLSRYYDEVIADLRDATSILIFGPGEAKGELKTQLESQSLGERIVGIETSDKMTDPQITAKVRDYFQRMTFPSTLIK